MAHNSSRIAALPKYNRDPISHRGKKFEIMCILSALLSLCPDRPASGWQALLAAVFML
jgi:hypothetical protein